MMQPIDFRLVSFSLVLRLDSVEDYGVLLASFRIIAQLHRPACIVRRCSLNRSSGLDGVSNIAARVGQHSHTGCREIAHRFCK
jgi:hypothetical protein